MRLSIQYPQEFKLPDNVRATTVASEAILGAQFAVHAVPCQSSRAFLRSIKDILPASVPIISVSKGLEVSGSELLSHMIHQTNHSKNIILYFCINLSYKYQDNHNPNPI